jgi:hypothetical protein
MIFDIYFERFHHDLQKAINKTTHFYSSFSNQIILEMDHLIWDRRIDMAYQSRANIK